MSYDKLFDLAEDWLDAWCDVHGAQAPSVFEPSFVRQATIVMAHNPDLADRTRDLPYEQWRLLVSHVRNAHDVMMRSSVRRTEEDRPA